LVISGTTCFYGTEHPCCHPANSVEALKERQSSGARQCPGTIVSSFTTILIVVDTFELRLPGLPFLSFLAGKAMSVGLMVVLMPCCFMFRTLLPLDRKSS